MTKIDTRLNDPDLQAWLKTKKNKSETTREALKMLYLHELNKNAENKTPEVKVIA